MWPVILLYLYRNIMVRNVFENYQFGHTPLFPLPRPNFHLVFVTEKGGVPVRPFFGPQPIGLKLRKIVPLNMTHEPLKRFFNWAFHLGEKTASIIAFYMGFRATWQII